MNEINEKLGMVKEILHQGAELNIANNQIPEYTKERLIMIDQLLDHGAFQDLRLRTADSPEVIERMENISKEKIQRSENPEYYYNIISVIETSKENERDMLYSYDANQENFSVYFPNEDNSYIKAEFKEDNHTKIEIVNTEEGSFMSYNCDISRFNLMTKYPDISEKINKLENASFICNDVKKEQER